LHRLITINIAMHRYQNPSAMEIRSDLIPNEVT
jgi:hypothetical protein